VAHARLAVAGALCARDRYPDCAEEPDPEASGRQIRHGPRSAPGRVQVALRAVNPLDAIRDLHGMGLLADIVVGVVGAIAGGFVARYLGVTTTATSHSIFMEIVIAFLGAVILLAILRLVGVGKRGRMSGELFVAVVSARGSFAIA
jgi:uncharacterized membrane protein YeaQ/YmgE (transglycosylase-associated protein family)